MKDKEVILEVTFSVPLREVKSYSLGGEYIDANGAHFHKSWLASWDLSERKIIFKKGWKFSKETSRGTPVLWFRNANVFGSEVGGSFMNASLAESVRDCRSNKVLYSK